MRCGVWMGRTRVIFAKYMVFVACVCVSGALMCVLRVLCCRTYVSRELRDCCDRCRGLTGASGVQRPRVAVCACPDRRDACTWACGRGVAPVGRKQSVLSCAEVRTSVISAGSVW